MKPSIAYFMITICTSSQPCDYGVSVVGHYENIDACIINLPPQAPDKKSFCVPYGQEAKDDVE